MAAVVDDGEEVAGGNFAAAFEATGVVAVFVEEGIVDDAGAGAGAAVVAVA